MRTYTISRSELDTVAVLATEYASIDVSHAERAETAPVLPTQIRKLSGGWVGAEWVRAVADYQDQPSVGYPSVEDLERDHEIPVEWDVDFKPLPTGV